LEAAIGVSTDHYSHHRYCDSLGNLTPADVFVGRAADIRRRQNEIKGRTLETCRLLHGQTAAPTETPMSQTPVRDQAVVFQIT